jgi:UDP-2,4-diacetamido-2,4,6-trideoxy-beta-L-altropyranose hydrolase
MKNVFMVTGGNNKTGYGHLFRCTSLAKVLAKNYTCSFLLLDTPKENITVVDEKKHFHQQVEMLNYLETHSSKHDLVVIDNYLIKEDFIKEVKSLNLKTVSINDLPELALPTDLIINHAINLQPDDFKVSSSKLLLGKEYLLLRSEFFEPQEKYLLEPAKEQILICFGGADPLGLSLKILGFLKPYLEKYQVAVMTNSDPLKKGLANFKKENPLFDIYIYSNLNGIEVVQLIKKSKVAIVPSSTISLECMCVNIELITGYFVDNQKVLSKSIRDLNLAINVGDFTELDEKTFDQYFQKAIQGGYKIKQKLFFDTDPSKNILREFKQLESSQNMKLRKVHFEDWKTLLEWRNDFETRTQSHTIEMITGEAHKDWLSNVINDPDRMLFVAEVNDIPVGTVRADFDATTNAYELSWTISPHARGQGIGKKIVKLLVEKLNSRVRAEIKEDNISSIKIAESANLKFHKKEKQVLHYCNY